MNSRKITVWSFAAILFVAVTTVVFGQETTGSIEGTIQDPQGGVVPGLTVTVTGVNTAYSRTIATDDKGFYRLSQVPPGTYVVSTQAKAGFSSAKVEGVEVKLGRSTAIDITVKAGDVAAVVDVSADEVLRIDPTSSKVQTNITQRQIEDLPKGANFTSLLKLSPSTRPEPKSGQFQVDGASGSENVFIIDGQEVNNFRTGILSSNNDLPLLFVKEMQIKTSGFEAEFGGATGGVINVVTKSGNNDFHGQFGVEFEHSKLAAGPRPILNSFRSSGTGANFVQINEYLRPQRDNYTYYYPSLLLSGPVIKDRLWFLASYAPQLLTTYRTTNYFTSDPRTRTRTATQDYKTAVRSEYAFVRLDAAPLDSLRISGTYTWNPIIQDGVLPSGNISIGGSIPSTSFGGTIGTLVGNQLTNQQGGRQNGNNVTAAAVWTPSSQVVASFRYSRGFLNEKLNSYFIPSETKFTCSNLAPPPSAGCALGFTNFSTNSQVQFDASVRKNYEADMSYLFSGLLGRHEFKGGYQWAKVSNDVSRGYVPYGQVVLQYGTSINELAPISLPVTPGAIGAGTLTRIGTQGSASNQLQSIYIQDKWQPTTRLSLNLGVRFEKEDLPSFNGVAPPINFGWGDKIAPRLGFAWDLTGSGKTKLFASYGQFYDRLKFEMPRGSFGGDFFRTDYFEILPGQPRYDFYTLQRILGNNVDVLGGKCPISNPTGLTKCQADFRIASNDPNATIFDGQVDPDMKPFRQTEFTVGIEREFLRNYLFGARYVYKNVDNAIEDAGFPNAQGSEAYIIGNPGSGLHAATAKSFGYVKTIEPQRRYDAFEVRLDRRLTTSFTYNVNYTYSRLYGNYSGLSSSDENGRNSPGVNRFFDLPFAGFTMDGTPDNGLLATDRPHVFNAYGSYFYDWFGNKSNQTEIGAFTTIQSGTPLTTFSSFQSVAQMIYIGRGDLGRTEKFTQSDVVVSHNIKLGDSERYSLRFTFNVINVFNEGNATNVANQIVGSGTLTGANLGLVPSDVPSSINQLLANGIRPQVDAYLNNPAQPQRRNTNLGLANTFQGPRNIRWGFSFVF